MNSVGLTPATFLPVVWPPSPFLPYVPCYNMEAILWSFYRIRKIIINKVIKSKSRCFEIQKIGGSISHSHRHFLSFTLRPCPNPLHVLLSLGNTCLHVQTYHFSLFSGAFCGPLTSLASCLLSVALLIIYDSVESVWHFSKKRKLSSSPEYSGVQRQGCVSPCCLRQCCRCLTDVLMGTVSQRWLLTICSVPCLS